MGALVAGAFSFLTESPLIFAVYVLAVLAALALWACYRLLVKVEKLEAPPKRPDNWEGIIRTVKTLEPVAHQVILEHHVCSHLKREHPERAEQFVVKDETWSAFDIAHHALKVEIDIAGTSLDRITHFNYMMAEFAASYFRYDSEEHDDEKYDKAYDQLKTGVSRIVSRLAN